MQHYIKKGKKYIPVNDPIAYDGLSEGSWLVIVDKNCKSIRRLINPKFIELDAALHYLREELMKAISKESELKPKSTPLTPKEKKAWEAFDKIMGDDKPRYFAYFSSYHDIAEAGCKRIKEIMIENDCDPKKIKKKYRTKKRNSYNPIFDLEV